MTEASLKSAFMLAVGKQLLGFVALRHEDIRTSGIPDLSITGFGKTSWFEFKVANPQFHGTELQELTMLRLAAAGFARYLVWSENKNGTGKRTLIIHPKEVFKKNGHVSEMEIEAFCVGYDHRWVCSYIRERHQV